MARFVRIAILTIVGLATLLYWQLGQSATPETRCVVRATPRVPVGDPIHYIRLPGSTTIGEQPKNRGPLVRVNVTPRDAKGLSLAVDGPYIVRDLKTKRVRLKRPNLKSVPIKLTKRGIRIGERTFRGDGVEILVRKSPAIWVRRHQYRGSIRLHRDKAGELVVVNVVPMEDYLASVVNGEMPAKFPDEARKAQVVVARTYARYRMQATRGFGLFDVYADSRGQRYLGFQYRTTDGRRLAGETKQSRELVAKTMGEVCRFKGRIFSPYYHAVCGGRTTAGKRVFSDSVTALQSVRCDWCRNAKRYRWHKTVSATQLTAAVGRILKRRKRPFGILRSITRAKAPETFTVSDGNVRETFTGRDLRSAFPPGTLASPRFDVRFVENRYVFTGRGHGHGVGLCQHGAAGLANAGRSYREILRYYYRGVEVGREK